MTSGATGKKKKNIYIYELLKNLKFKFKEFCVLSAISWE